MSRGSLILLVCTLTTTVAVDPLYILAQYINTTFIHKPCDPLQISSLTTGTTRLSDILELLNHLVDQADRIQSTLDRIINDQTEGDPTISR